MSFVSVFNQLPIETLLAHSQNASVNQALANGPRQFAA
jgi:hypothetical protein